MRYTYIFLSLFLTSFLPAHAQPGKLFSVDNDLSSSLINHIYQDHNNIIWIATEDGLNRYDGSKFTVYRKNRKDTTSLLHNYVRLVYQDKNKHLFIGFFNGLQVYDEATDKFTEIPLILESGVKYPSHVTSILQRSNGEVLIGTTGHGLFVLKTEKGVMRAHQQSSLVPSYLIRFIYEDAQQNVWVGTQDKGLFLLGKNQSIKNYSVGNGENIHDICEDINGNLYVGSSTTGLFSFDKKTESFYPTLPKTSSLSINTLSRNSTGEILIGTEGKGLKIFNPETGQISDGNFNIDTYDFSKSKVHSVIEDESGNTWLGIFQKGVILLPAKNNNFEYYGHKSIKNNVIGSNNITALCKDHIGNLWVGTDGDGIYKLDTAGNRVAHFKPSSGPAGSPASIFSIHEDSEHTLWIGSYDRGICKMNTASGKCTYINQLLTNNANQILRVFSMAEDSNKNLWVGTLGSGLYSINLTTLQVNHYKALVGNEYRPELNVLLNDWIGSMLFTPDEKLYIGTMDGLGCLDLKSMQFTSRFGKNRLFAGVPIHALFEDTSGTLWVGTSDGMFSIPSKENKQDFTLYTTDDGLPSNEVHAILEDSLGSIWISTNYGISRFNPKNRSFINYYSGDGLQGNEFTGAACMGNNGQLVFGGINGITLFNPKEITGDVKKLNVRVTGFYIHNKAVNKGMKSGNYDIINLSVMNADTFHLAHNDNSFTVEFSVMEFSNPERITYLYSINGNDWITLRPGTDNVTFSDLSPGTYTFEVKAKNYNIYSQPKTIHIIIHPVWYFSIWAKWAYFILSVAVIFVIIQQVLQRQETKREMQEHIHAQQIVEAKLQFFINIAHEIRTPMTLIISPLKKLISKDNDRDRKRSYFLMNKNAERILHLINQLMDIQKIDKGQMILRFQDTEMVEYINELCHVFDEQTQGKQIKLQYIHEMDTLHAWIDPNNFDKVILNVLSNALNFTPVGGQITVSLSVARNEENSVKDKAQDYFQIIISDTGTGISNDELEKVFECFYQARERKHSSTGTGIGLYLTRSIVELHQGNIRSENNQDGPGCSFIIQIPLGTDHLKPEQKVLNGYVSGPKKEYVTSATESTTDVLEPKIKSKSKHRILVVDDDADIRKYICDEMAADYHMEACTNGKEALSLVLKNTPDLIISDIMMPEMDGITLCQKIKQNVNINHIPVILLTAKAEEEDSLEGLGIGADAYIVKPFNMELLRVTIQNIIKNRNILKNNFTGSQQQKDKVADVAVISSDEKLLSRIMETINANLDNPTLNVEMLSREIGISRVHLHRKLKELTNQTTRDLIRNIRLQQAAKLLSEKQLHVSEVAFAVGFTNVAHFSSTFKDFYGVPPTTYMENQLKDQKKKQHPLSK